MEGTIEKWLDDKNFGFIDIGEEKGLFFHRNELAEGYSPREGDKVEFEKAEGEKGPMAVKVKAASAASTEEAPAEAEASEEVAEEAPAEEAAEEAPAEETAEEPATEEAKEE